MGAAHGYGGESCDGVQEAVDAESPTPCGTVEEVRAVLERLEGVEALVAGVLYGGGLRL